MRRSDTKKSGGAQWFSVQKLATANSNICRFCFSVSRFQFKNIINATGIAATGIDATGIDATGIDATGINATGIAFKCQIKTVSNAICMFVFIFGSRPFK